MGHGFGYDEMAWSEPWYQVLHNFQKSKDMFFTLFLLSFVVRRFSMFFLQPSLYIAHAEGERGERERERCKMMQI